MRVIASRANPLFKRLRALAGSAQRQRREGIALLEGTHLATAYLDAAERDGGQPTDCVVAAGAQHHPEVATVLTRVARIDASLITVLADDLFEQIAPVANGGIGLLLLAPVPSVALDARVDGDCVVLDGVQDAGNAGSILRSAAAAGIAQAFCMPGTANAWSAKVLRAAMGAHFAMRIIEGVAGETLRERLAGAVAITDSHGQAAIYDADLRAPLAWVFGNEGAGVSAFWRAAATYRLTIPQPGPVESLNVAAAAAVCLFEQCRQRRLVATGAA